MLYILETARQARLEEGVDTSPGLLAWLGIPTWGETAKKEEVSCHYPYPCPLPMSLQLFVPHALAKTHTQPELSGGEGEEAEARLA